MDGALQINIASSQNAADAIRIVASAGGIDIDAVGAAGEDISVVNTGGSLILQATESANDAISIEATAGGIDILASGAAAGEDIDIAATGSSVNISASEDAADAITIVASAGGIDVTAAGAAGEDIDITCTSGSVNITAGESAADAVVIDASGAAGAIQLNSGTGGVVMDSGLTMSGIVSKANADTPYTLLGSDYMVSCDVSAGVLSITLPASPATGRTVVVYDASGNASANNITMNGNGKNIALGGSTAATKTIATDYGSAILRYNGTLWLGQAIA